MKKSYLLVLFGMVFLLNSCDMFRDPLQKKWKVADVNVPNVSALMKLAPMISGSSKLSQLVPKSMLENGTKGLIVEILKQTTFEFQKDSKCEVNIFGKKATGTYRLSEDKKTLTITSDLVKLGNKMMVKELSSSKLTFDMELEGQTITFMLQPE